MTEGVSSTDTIRRCCVVIRWMRRDDNTRSPEAPAAVEINLHVSPRPASASVCMCTSCTWATHQYVSQP